MYNALPQVENPIFKWPDSKYFRLHDCKSLSQLLRKWFDTEAAVDNQMNVCGSVLVKLYHQKQAMDWIWPAGCCLPNLEIGQNLMSLLVPPPGKTNPPELFWRPEIKIFVSYIIIGTHIFSLFLPQAPKPRMKDSTGWLHSHWVNFFKN